MSNANNNVVTRKNTGSFGKQVVFRQRAGNTIMCNYPKPRTGEPTADQQVIRERFQAAIRYAKAAIANEAVKASYQAVAKEGQSAYNLAMADAFKAPEIKNIDPGQYTGQPNSTISINAVDDFMVQSVYVTILNAADEVVEEGQAVVDPNTLFWTYTAVNLNPNLTGSKVKVQASDLPGNAVTQELAL